MTSALSLEQSVRNYRRHLTIERGLSVNTLAAYGRDLERYTVWLDSHGITDARLITTVQISVFTRDLKALAVPAEAEPGAGSPPAVSLAASSVARILSSVRGFHRFLAEEGDVATDASRDVKPPKLASRLPKAITIAEMQLLIDSVVGDDPLALRDRALLELLYATGARVSEVVGLNVDDVLDGLETVRLVGKGSKHRIVPVGGFARAAVEAYLVRVRPQFSARGLSTPALFLGQRGQRLSRQGAWLVIQAAAKKSGLEAHVSPHTFRHSFATHLLEGGADVRVVQELLGHSSVTTTQLYTLVTADTLRDIYATSHPRAR